MGREIGQVDVVRSLSGAYTQIWVHDLYTWPEKAENLTSLRADAKSYVCSYVCKKRASWGVS